MRRVPLSFGQGQARDYRNLGQAPKAKEIVVSKDQLHRRDIVIQVKPGETQQQAFQRRLKESAEVNSRIKDIHTVSEFSEALSNAGDKLVVLEVEQEGVCDTGLPEEAELHWQEDKDAKLEPCQAIKHTFQRTARECPDCEFLMIQSDPNDEQTNYLLDQLEVDTFPSLIFFREGRRLWHHNGVLHLDTRLAGGVMYYGDQAAGGEKPSEYVAELTSRDEVDAWLASGAAKLMVLDVCTQQCQPCVMIYPAVTALAKSLQGVVAFGRVIVDEVDDGDKLASQWNLKEVPTFLFYQDGKEVDRHVGSSRGDLIGHILMLAQRLGLSLPEPKAPAVAKRRQIRRAVARK